MNAAIAEKDNRPLSAAQLPGATTEASSSVSSAQSLPGPDKVKRANSMPFAPSKNKAKGLVDAQKQARDGLIMDTNKSSIVSKRSVERLYYEGEPEYFRYFVTKFKRRSPLINRGYWLRMKAIEHGVARFLAERTAKRKVVVNLGCG